TTPSTKQLFGGEVFMDVLILHHLLAMTGFKRTAKKLSNG
ncbi:hypothetical protein AC249_AIPGENE28952, partial [Exaiptasia diaphana]